MKNLTNSIAVAVRMTTLNVANRMHEAVRSLGNNVTPSMLDLMISIGIIEGGYSFENIQAKNNFSKSVLKELKKDFSRDFSKVYSDQNERILV